MRTSTVLAAAAALVAAGSALPATAAPKPKPKPITKTYTATAPTPDPTNSTETTYTVCAQIVPLSFQVENFKAPAAGKLAVKLSGFTGDWDLLLLDSKGTEIAAGSALAASTPVAAETESMTAKIKKAGAYKIIACNFAGGPTGTVSYTFTYA